MHDRNDFGMSYPSPPRHFMIDMHHRHLTNPRLKADDEANQRKSGTDLFKWATDLVKEFYNMTETCLVESYMDLYDLPDCKDTDWSSLSSDPKSEIGDVNPETGRLIEEEK